MLAPWEKRYDKSRQHIKKQRHHFADKMDIVKARASLVVQMVKNPPAMWETWVRSLGWEDPLEEGMATHSSILAWRIPVDRRAWKATVQGRKESDTTE